MVVEKSRTISEVANSYGLVTQTVGNWVNKWRKTHSGIEGEEMTAAHRRQKPPRYHLTDPPQFTIP